MVKNIVEMGNILSNKEAGECFSGCSIGLVGGNCADDLDSFSFSQEENRTSADSINCNSINKVGVSELLSCADVTEQKWGQASKLLSCFLK